MTLKIFEIPENVGKPFAVFRRVNEKARPFWQQISEFYARQSSAKRFAEKYKQERTLSK